MNENVNNNQDESLTSSNNPHKKLSNQEIMKIANNCLLENKEKNQAVESNENNKINVQSTENNKINFQELTFMTLISLLILMVWPASWIAGTVYIGFVGYNYLGHYPIDMIMFTTLMCGFFIAIIGRWMLAGNLMAVIGFFVYLKIPLL